MRKYDTLLQVVRECDYRFLEGPVVCGCQSPETRCLMGRGGWARDRHAVNPNDCLQCTAQEKTPVVSTGASPEGITEIDETTGSRSPQTDARAQHLAVSRRTQNILLEKAVSSGRVVDENSEAGETGDGVSNDHNFVASENFRNGTKLGRPLVPVSTESGIERSILRLEREFQEIWFDIVNLQNFRNPATEQGQAALFNALKGGGFGSGFHPGDFGCPGGMPATLNWSDPVFGNGTLTFNPGTNCYSSGQVLATVPAACDGSCPGASNVPMQVDYCPDGVTTSFKCDGSGCPTSGSLGDSMGCNFGWPAPTILVCDTVTPSNTTSNPTAPNDVSNGSPANKMGYCPPNDVASFGPGKPAGSECPTQPRTVYLKSATYGLFTLIYNDAVGHKQWESLHKTIAIPANVNGSGCPARNVSIQVFRNPLSPPGTPSISCKHVGLCADDAGTGPSLVDNWFTYVLDSCNPYRAHGAGGGSGTVIPNTDTYTIN